MRTYSLNQQGTYRTAVRGHGRKQKLPDGRCRFLVGFSSLAPGDLGLGRGQGLCALRTATMSSGLVLSLP